LSKEIAGFCAKKRHFIRLAFFPDMPRIGQAESTESSRAVRPNTGLCVRIGLTYLVVINRLTISLCRSGPLETKGYWLISGRFRAANASWGNYAELKGFLVAENKNSKKNSNDHPGLT